MRKGLFFILAGSFMLAALLYIYKFNALQAITYFPIDEENTITEADSELSFSQAEDKNSYLVTWKVHSKSSRPLYLRQDAALLFADGKLLGVKSKWTEDTADIQLEEQFQADAARRYQTISYHHGEVHYPDNTIKSIHAMSRDRLYIVHDKEAFTAFHSPGNNSETVKKNALDTRTKQRLLYHWNKLLVHFQVDKASYEMVPLSSLYKYHKQAIPGLTQAETDRVIGQLWEGLYKNYIVPAAKKRHSNTPDFMPIILFSKDQTHLLVLFELDGKKQKLIQQYR